MYCAWWASWFWARCGAGQMHCSLHPHSLQLTSSPSALFEARKLIWNGCMGVLLQVTQAVEALGAGEILLNSIDNDGQNDGYDIPLIRSVKQVRPLLAGRTRGRAAPLCMKNPRSRHPSRCDGCFILGTGCPDPCDCVERCWERNALRRGLQ